MEFSYNYHSEDMSFSSMAKKHYHNSSAEIYYLEKGECIYFIEDRAYHAIAGDIIIIPQGVIHKTTYKAPYSRRLLTFDSELMPELSDEDYSSILYVYRNYSIQGEVKSIFKKIYSEYSNPDKYTDNVLNLLIHQLIYLLVRNENNADSTAYSTNFVAEASKYIMENYAEDITLFSVAEIVSVSGEHLSRTFKKDTGFGFNEYLNLVRLKKADEMLRLEPEKSISEIAISCGFNDSNYFSDKFKGAYGISPIKYRKRIEKANAL